MTTKKDDNLPTDAEVRQAQKEGILDAVREAQTAQPLDSPAPDVKGDPYVGKDEIMPWAHYVDFSLDQLKKALKVDADPAIPDNKVAGLLGLERGGKNRTDFVKAYMDRLKIANKEIKTPYDVTDAGPPYTNDVSNITEF